MDIKGGVTDSDIPRFRNSAQNSSEIPQFLYTQLNKSFPVVSFKVGVKESYVLMVGGGGGVSQKNRTL